MDNVEMTVEQILFSEADDWKEQIGDALKKEQMRRVQCYRRDLCTMDELWRSLMDLSITIFYYLFAPGSRKELEEYIKTNTFQAKIGRHREEEVIGAIGLPSFYLEKSDVNRYKKMEAYFKSLSEQLCKEYDEDRNGVCKLLSGK